MLNRKLAVLFVSIIGAASILAQPVQPRLRMTGFGSGHLTTESAFEQRAMDAIRPSRIDSILSVIASEVRVAGSKADERVRDYVVKTLTAAGLDTKVTPYEIYLPHAISSSLKLNGKAFVLHEKLLPGETPSKDPSYPWVNGYAGDGTAKGAFVNVNYGLHEDYRLLDSLGVSVKGKIAIARYGKSYRGIKAQLAEEHGASGLIIYSDPANDGYVVGDIMPNGPWRSNDAVQRGSIYNGHGDPTTPGFSSVPGVKRLPLNRAQKLSAIPVIPVSYEIASQLFGQIDSGEIPNQSWQGGLPVRYHLLSKRGATLELTVKTDKKVRTIWNTVSTIRGSELPDEWIVVGGHRDAWCRGAEDNGSGAACVVALAEAMSKLSKDGLQPKRSIIFATWDGEEWGLLGSTEWVEQMEQELGAKAVAYLNLDMCTTGKDFGASADPLLGTLIREATQSVSDPAGGTVYEKWRDRVKPTQPVKSRGGKAEPEVGLLGGGSDFSGFYNHLGIPSTEHGFSGPFGRYHSDHDNMTWTRKYGDSSMRYHKACSDLLAVEALRLANSDVLPYDFEELAMYIARFETYANTQAKEKGLTTADFSPLDKALSEFRDAAEHFNVLRDDKGFSDGSTIFANAKNRKTVNDQLRAVTKALTVDEGLSTDSWVRNPLVISDPMNGYAELTLPGIQLATREGSAEKVNQQIAKLADLLHKAAGKLNEAVLTLRGE